MLSRILSIALMASAGLCPMSCSRPKRPPISDKVPLTHVTGKVVVDGVPTPGVHVRYIPQGDIAEKRDRYLNRFFLLTRDDGTFSLSTYLDGDGIPYGEYVLEFKWLEQLPSGERDRLGGSYAIPRSPFLTIQVEAGRDLDLGEIRLKSRTEQARRGRK